MRRFLSFCMFLMAVSTTAFAQDDGITVKCKRNVLLNEQFQISFEVSGDSKDFHAPNFPHFQLVGGPYQSSSSSVQIINGSITKSQTKTYSYYLVAIEEGSFKIAPASAVIDGKKVRGEEFEITVSANGNNANNATVRKQGQQSNNQTSSDGRDIFVESSSNKKTLYLGEQNLITYRLYFSVPVSQLQVSKSPSYAKFWTKDITDNNGAPQQSTISVGGRQYQTASIMEVVTIPQSVGTLKIDPLSLTCYTQVRNSNNRQNGYDPFDNFFNDVFSNSYSTVKREIQSQPIEIEVKPLPTEGKPMSFQGAVGQYTFTSKIDKTELKANEAFTLIFTVSGKGNIELFDMPKPDLPPDFEVYDPKINTKTKNNSFGISGTKTVEYVIIPRSAGTFDIKSVEFSYFDPQKEKYVTLKSDVYQMHVAKGSESGGNVVYHSGQEDIKYIGNDIQHINMTDTRLVGQGNAFYRSTAYFILIFSLFILLVLALCLDKKIHKFNQNEVLVRNKKATKTAKKRLKKAYEFMKEKKQDNFYEEFSQALWGYISDKLNIARSQLSMDTVRDMMSAKKAPSDVIDNFVGLLNSCEFARFAPGSAEEKMDSLYSQGIDAIIKAEKNLK